MFYSNYRKKIYIYIHQFMTPQFRCICHYMQICDACSEENVALHIPVLAHDWFQFVFKWQTSVQTQFLDFPNTLFL